MCYSHNFETVPPMIAFLERTRYFKCNHTFKNASSQTLLSFSVLALMYPVSIYQQCHENLQTTSPNILVQMEIQQQTRARWSSSEGRKKNSLPAPSSGIAPTLQVGMESVTGERHLPSLRSSTENWLLILKASVFVKEVSFVLRSLLPCITNQ